MSRVLVIGDLHCPADHSKYLKFCKDLYAEWRCNRVVFIGDIMDWHSISFHATHPELPGPADEYKLALFSIKKWYKAFPKAEVMIGNHDARVNRLALDAKIPEFMLRQYKDIWKTPKWDWKYDTVIDKVYYFHGEGTSGKYPAFNRACSIGESVVSGHVHAAAGVQWTTTPRKRIFGANTGCGVDVDKLQFAYGKHFLRRPVLSALVVLDGTPYHEIFRCDPGEKYAKIRSKT